MSEIVVLAHLNYIPLEAIREHNMSFEDSNGIYRTYLVRGIEREVINKAIIGLGISTDDFFITHRILDQYFVSIKKELREGFQDRLENSLKESKR